jgi:hypothetical protein
MNKRPKSREETPKEGSDSARRYRTATICDRAAQSARPFEIFPVHSLLKTGLGRRDKLAYFINNIIYLNMIQMAFYTAVFRSPNLLSNS